VQAQRAGAFFALAVKCLPVPAVLSSSSSSRYAAVAPALATSTAAPTPTAAAAGASSNPTDSSTAAAIAAAVAAVRDAPLSSDVAAALLHSPAAAGSTSDDTTAATTSANEAAAAVAEGHWRCTVCTRVSAYPDWYDPAKGGRPELRMVVKQGEVDAKKLRAQFTPILSTPKVSTSTSSYRCYSVTILQVNA
jgi:hypothetical protein